MRFEITFSPSVCSEPLDGRLLLLISTNPEAEPRFQINDSATTQVVFGIDLDGWIPGVSATVDGSAFGYPLRSLNDLPDGSYTVQALLHRYETFHRADGHTVKLPMDRGEGQHWNLAPANLYSLPVPMELAGGPEQAHRIALDQPATRSDSGQRPGANGHTIATPGAP